MPWFPLSGDSRITKRCATEGCAGQPSWRLEAEGVGSDYCSGCMRRIGINHLQGRMVGERAKWTCVARSQGTAAGNDPADCDWPACGCDSYALHVLHSLHEQGWRSPDEVEEYAKKVRAQVVREYEADEGESA